LPVGGKKRRKKRLFLSLHPRRERKNESKGQGRRLIVFCREKVPGVARPPVKLEGGGCFYHEFKGGRKRGGGGAVPMRAADELPVIKAPPGKENHKDISEPRQGGKGVQDHTAEKRKEGTASAHRARGDGG